MQLLSAFVGVPEVNRVYNVDALTLLRAMPDSSVDMVFIDPPYGNNNGVDDLAAARAKDKVRGGRQSGTITPIANDSAIDWKVLMPPILREINRTLKPVGACCCCAGGGGGADGVMSTYAQLDAWLHEYQTFFNAVIWDKSARGFGMGWRYRRNYEFVMVSHKRGGKLSWNEKRPAQPNVINFHPTDNALHPTQKPVTMIEWFIENHTLPGQLVVDVFAGSGTTALAAKNVSRKYIVGDMDAGYVEVMRKRLSHGYTPSFMPQLETA